MDDLIKHLKQSFEDQVMTRSERRSLKQVIADMNLDRRQRDFLRSQIFDIALDCLSSEKDRRMVEWLEQANKLLLNRQANTDSLSKVYFSPGEACLTAINTAIGQATNKLKIAVFTISDNRITNQIITAHRRGVDVRIITDNDKTEDLGSDIEQLAQAGINVRIDQSRHHMHHKFAVIDSQQAITGSYNWTRSAEQYNQENILLTQEGSVVKTYEKAFDELWNKTTPF